MRKLIILSLFLTIKIAYPQEVSGGNARSGGNLYYNKAVSNSFVGGQVPIPVTAITRPAIYIFNSADGNTYLQQDGPTTDPNAGLFSANSAACEANPSTCSWTPINHAGEPIVSGSYTAMREMLDIDSTHKFIIWGFNPNSGSCSVCTLTILNTSTNVFTTITLPSKPSGESNICITKDSTGIGYTFLNYHSGLWKSTSSAMTSWTLITTDLSLLPGLSGTSGNTYTCKVLGTRIYFGGESGVLSCDLAFTSCSQDYLPFGTGHRNFEMHLADVDGGSPSNPTIMIECCKDNLAGNATVLSTYTSGTWTQLVTGSGAPAIGNQTLYFDTYGVAIGTGSARRYYYLTFPSSVIGNVVVSTSSAGTNWTAYSPTQWPARTSTYSGRQISSNPSTNIIWGVFSGSAGVGVYVSN